MPDLQQHVVTHTNGTRYVHRRRPPDAFERLLGAALVVAIGAVAVIVMVVQDLARRLGA